MKERPIIFSSDMVRAILEGSKIQTRRPLKPQPKEIYGNGEWYPGYNHTEYWCFWGKKGFYVVNKCGLPEFKCPYGEIGDHLWVREKFILFQNELLYYADQRGNECFKWKPSIHMPRRASRITLEILDIRVERVQDISEQDAMAEGVLASQSVEMKDGSPCYTLPFRIKWDTLYGIDNQFAWERNPWVWVIGFKEV